MSTVPDPAVVAVHYTTDLEALLDHLLNERPGLPPFRRNDGTPLNPDEVALVRRATHADLKAASNMFLLAGDHAADMVTDGERLEALTASYHLDPDEELGSLRARMTERDQAEWDRLFPRVYLYATDDPGAL